MICKTTKTILSQDMLHKKSTWLSISSHYPENRRSIEVILIPIGSTAYDTHTCEKAATYEAEEHPETMVLGVGGRRSTYIAPVAPHLGACGREDDEVHDVFEVWAAMVDTSAPLAPIAPVAAPWFGGRQGTAALAY
ncbi:hypothetical protein CHU98_g8656 [Xylaria longipes]|nr:hypothetical protein CHU98_g8656 [Xylaria longipes]